MNKTNETQSSAQNSNRQMTEADKVARNRIITEAVDRFFYGMPFAETMDSLANATHNHTLALLEDVSVEDVSDRTHVAAEVWHITNTMAFLSELYQCQSWTGR